MIVNGLGMLLLFVVVIWLPGRLLAALLVPEQRPEERLPYAVTLGVVTVHTAVILFVGGLGLFSPFYATRAVVVGVALAIAGVTLLLVLRRNGWRWPAGLLWLRPNRSHGALLALSALAFAWFLLQYDADQVLEDSCIVQSSMAIDVNFARPGLLAKVYDAEALRFLDADWVALGEDPNNSFLFDYGQRLGPGVLIAPFVAAFGAFGLRICFALQGLILPGLGLMLGFALLRRRRSAWLLAVLLTFNPYALDINVNDENFIALWSGTAALCLLLRARPAVIAAAIALGMFLGTRHVGLMMLPVLFWYIFTDRRMGRRATVVFALTLVASCLPYLILHGKFLLSGEELYEGKPVLFGLPPLADSLLRSPYNAYPNLLLYPLDLLHRYGLLLAAALPAGLWLLWRQRRRELLLLAGWMIPIWLIILPMSNWVEANKIGIPASVLATLVVVLVSGLEWLSDKQVAPLRRLAGGGLGGLLVAGFALPAAAVQTEADERVYTMFGEHPGDGSDGMPAGVPPIVREAPAYVDWDRGRYAPRLLPDPGGAATVLMTGVRQLRLRQLQQGLAHPSVAEHNQPLTDWYSTQIMGPGFFVSALSIYRVAEGGPVAPPLWPRRQADDGTAQAGIRADVTLMEPPAIAALPLLPPSPDGGAVLNAVDGPPVLVSGLRVDWLEGPQNAVLARDALGTVHLLLLPFDANLVHAPERLGLSRVDGKGYGGRLPLLLPAGGLLRIHDARSYATSRTLVRYISLGSDNPGSDLLSSRPAVVQF